MTMEELYKAINKEHVYLGEQMSDAQIIRHVWNMAIETSASVVDLCNHEGPYNAIGAASRIRTYKID